MKNAVGVRHRQAAAQLPADIGDFLRWQPADAPQKRGQVLALDELHRIEDAAGGFPDIEHAAHGRMRNLPRQPDFVEDALAAFRGRRVNQLQRDRGQQDQVIGLPDVAHAAPSDSRDHPVAAREHLARRERGGGDVWRARLDRFVVFVKFEKRFGLLPQGGVIAARLRQKGRALGGGPIESGEKHVFRALMNGRHR